MNNQMENKEMKKRLKAGYLVLLDAARKEMGTRGTKACAVAVCLATAATASALDLTTTAASIATDAGTNVAAGVGIFAVLYGARVAVRALLSVA